MYGYGNSGNILGILIGVIIVSIIIFLICRELICWYWKINKLVSLMEEQNNLLKNFLEANKTITKYNNLNTTGDGEIIKESINVDIAENSEEIPNSNQLCTATVETAIRGGPDNDSYTVKTLNIGEKIIFQNILNNDPTWYYVKTQDSKYKGWCYAKHLKKC